MGSNESSLLKELVEGDSRGIDVELFVVDSGPRLRGHVPLGADSLCVIEGTFCRCGCCGVCVLDGVDHTDTCLSSSCGARGPG